LKEFQYSGIWWLPNKPNNQISGDLEFHPAKGASLQLNGSFTDITDSFESSKEKIILGVTPNGKEITLFRCFRSSVPFHIPGYQTSTYQIDFVLLGCHFKKDKDMTFFQVSTNYSLLDEWIDKSGLTTNHEMNIDGQLSHMEIDFKYTEKEKILIDNFHISFNYGIEGNVSKRGVAITELSLVNISSRKQIHLIDFLTKICNPIEEFICLGTGSPVYPKKMFGRSRKKRIKMPNGKYEYQGIDIYYKIRRFIELNSEINQYDLLFLYPQISDRIDYYLSNWIRNYKKLDDSFKLYFGVLREPSLYIDLQFLCLIYALETYHRNIHGGHFRSESQYHPIKRIITNAIPSDLETDFKDSLKSKIRYGYEYSLRKRLRDILEQHEDIFQELIGNKKQFINDVVFTRNYLTHHDKSDEKKAKKDTELYYLFQKVKLILVACFLTEIGMDKEMIKQLIHRNRRYISLIKRDALI